MHRILLFISNLLCCFIIYQRPTELWLVDARAAAVLGIHVNCTIGCSKLQKLRLSIHFVLVLLVQLLRLSYCTVLLTMDCCINSKFHKRYPVE